MSILYCVIRTYDCIAPYRLCYVPQLENYKTGGFTYTIKHIYSYVCTYVPGVPEHLTPASSP